MREILVFLTSKIFVILMFSFFALTAYSIFRVFDVEEFSSAIMASVILVLATKIKVR